MGLGAASPRRHHVFVKLRDRTLEDLAYFITDGDTKSREQGAERFPYRTGREITGFFRDCGLSQYVHRNASRTPWTHEVLIELNDGPCARPELPSRALVTVIQRLLDREVLLEADLDVDDALEAIRRSLHRDRLEPYFDELGDCQVRAGTATSAVSRVERVWTPEDLELKDAWTTFLDDASEDEFTEHALVPLLHQCGFKWITAAGHRDKALEYGKDLWMKLYLQTDHWIYFAIQVKKGKIDSAGRTVPGNENVTEVLNQVRMALGHALFDPSVNRKVLVDHVYVVASGTITKQARNFLVGSLDEQQRRHLLFLDRTQLLERLVALRVPLPAR